MRIVAISDTHTFESPALRLLPKGDVLIHAGDATINGEYSEVACFIDWFSDLPYKHKILIAGNHDWLFQVDPQEAHNLVNDNSVHYLQDSSVTIQGVTFYGSPWQPRFGNWAFNLDRGEEIKRKWDLIPSCDVLITHGPPWGILDTVVPNSEHLGCEELARVIRRVKPKVHICGHIHGGYGEHFTDGIHFINASICDESYRPVNQPIVFDI